MSKSYKIKVNQGGGEAKFVDIPQVSAGGQPLAVKAVPGGKYQLVDASTGYGPENIRASRSGQNLKVFFEGRTQPDLVIEDYYKETPEGFNGLIGEAETGRFYEYIPETAAGTSAVPLLADGSNQVGMALGGAEINASGAAVGALVAAAGLNPLLLAPLALLGAAGGGGGGGGTPDTTPPVIKSAKLHVDDDTGAKDNVTSDKTPRITGETEPNANVSVEVNGKTYTGTANGSGVFVIQVPDADALKDGPYTPKVTATDAANNKSAVFDGTPFKVDTSPEKNEPDNDPNATSVIDIVSITVDSGQNKTDFYTNDNQLLFNGTLKNFTDNGDWVKLELRDPTSKLIDTAYVKPVANGSTWDWTWDRSAQDKLVDGQYSLTAVVVDGADNIVGSGNTRVSDVQAITIDTVGPQGNRGLAIVSMSMDSGVGGVTDPSRTDFKTNDNTPSFTGKLSEGLQSGENIFIQLMKGNDVVDSGFATVSGTGWTWAPSTTLLDSTYKLNAQVVDAAGNPAVTAGSTTVIPPSSQDVVIDTKGSSDGDDGNKGLKTTGISLSTDTAGEQKTNSDFVTSDGANKDSVTGNDDDKLTFTGTLSSGFTKNGGKVWVQIIDANGVAKSNAYVEPETVNSNTWKYENLVPLAEGQYVAKSILMDHVGNIISASDQSFAVDITISDWTRSQSTTSGQNITTFDNFSFSMNESGTYRFGPNGELKNYNGGSLIFDAANKEFSTGQFVLDFWDQAGNLRKITNEGGTWIFGTAAPAVAPQPTDATYLASKDFSGLKAVGTVGKIDVSSNFDMASLYDGIDSVADKTAANHVVLSNTSDVILNVSMGDVLALGVTNSFSIAVGANSLHKGQTQMRIDGQSGDQVNLDGLVNGEKWVWTGGENSTNSPLGIGSDTYDVYTNTALGVALFIDQDVKVNIL
ncbi:Ig-like domain-containing protein [Limnohabitans sp. 63ED37-2]|uniref:Ig-like domain-containing protein n=1 Tax=Limnohabitans sp. 63ED37-2 TaxID=1678128 RepID=UPI0007060DD5|nr:Ig-like domain-containing protein [Limnohabitans sp. 63ED37-2]ALK88683.1 hypothetical protein L63ED372_01474 [Limnohabitans sp. 63ED37-2]